MEAQKLFFAYIGVASPVVEGQAGERKGETEDLNPLFSANFDTVNAGPKMEANSYVKIAREMGKGVRDILFLSDNVKEIQAAKEAGMPALLVDRPGNAPLSKADREAFIVIETLNGVILEKR